MARAHGPVPFVVALLRRYVQSPGLRVIDVGCGASHYRDVTVGEYVGVDYVANSYGASSSIDVIAPAEELPFEDASADLVLTVGALYQFAKPEAALFEFHRVLRPSGRVLIVDYNRRAQKRLERLEKAPRPKWTTAGLRRKVLEAGFGRAELLLPMEVQPSGLERLVRLTIEELRGQWAIVTAVRPT
jgi:ubiquinone/menaquinone biosynthesis C-methylase UbiE